MKTVAWSGLTFLALALAAPALADVTLIGSATIPWDATDKSGLTGMIGDSKIPRSRLASMGSGLAYTGRGSFFLAVCDRGPSDGAVEFDTRFQVISIDITHPGTTSRGATTTSAEDAGGSMKVSLAATILFRDADGRGYSGSAAAFDQEYARTERRSDTESIAVSRSGTVFTGDEYGPWIDEWSPTGAHLRRIPAPAKFLVAARGPTPESELPPHNTSGRQPNRGMEGIAFSPDGATLYGMMQSPLIQDGALDIRNKRIGTTIRMVELSLASGKTREFAYTLDDPSHGVNEMTTVGERSFLVLEKDGKEGTRAKVRHVYLVDLAGATDISGVKSLPANGLPAGVVAVKKRLVLDMLDPRFGLAGRDMPEKVEGLAFGPDLSDGRHVLIVASDNDFREGQPSRFWAFAIDPSDLPGFEPRKFDQPWQLVGEQVPSEHPVIKDFHSLGPDAGKTGLYRSACPVRDLAMKAGPDGPTEDDRKEARARLQSLYDLGVRTIISFEDITDEQVIAAVDPIAAEILAHAHGDHDAVLFHCSAGHERTGLVAAYIRMKYQHWTADRAIDEMRALGENWPKYSRNGGVSSWHEEHLPAIAGHSMGKGRRLRDLRAARGRRGPRPGPSRRVCRCIAMPAFRTAAHFYPRSAPRRQLPPSSDASGRCPGEKLCSTPVPTATSSTRSSRYSSASTE